MKSGYVVPLGEKIGYSCGDVASNLIFQTSMLFLAYFYTDVFGISATAVALMMLLTRIWDAVNDPIMGTIADRTNTKWGKFRPYLLWFAVPYGAVSVLLFLAPDLPITGKIVYAYVTYTAMGMIYTAINVPYAALMGVISPNGEERTVISSFRFVGAFTGGLIVQVFIPTIVARFADEAMGYRVVMLGVAVLSVILFFITFFNTNERVKPPKEQQTRFLRDAKELFLNKPWVLIALATVMQLTFIAMRNGSIMYYFKYYIETENLVLFGKEIPWLINSAFMVTGTIITILGTMTTKWFTSFMDRGRLYAVFMVLNAIFMSFIFFLGPNQIELLFLFNMLASFIMGPLAVLQWTIYTDTADYAEWKFNRRATGLLMAASLFALKVGLALGGAILLWIMDAYGFKANVEQTKFSLTGIRMVISIYPAIGALAAGAFMFFYPLTNKKMREIETELQARRA